MPYLTQTAREKQVQGRTGALGVAHVAADNGATVGVGAWDEVPRAWLASCTPQHICHETLSREMNQLHRGTIGRALGVEPSKR